MRRAGARIGKALVALSLVLWLLWSALTLWYSNLKPSTLRQALALAYLAWLMFAWFRFRERRLPVVAVSGALVTLVYLLTFPSNERDWMPDVAVAATADVRGSQVLVHGVRNFRYRSEDDFDAAWEDRAYDLDRLRTLDLFMSYWGPIDYCHTILSFGFEGGEYLAASVEARKERGESYSTFGGFFKMFELSYVFADERDVIGLRTNHRREDVYLYRVRAEPERLRELLLSYLRFATELAEEPQFYRVIRNSCGVNILQRAAETGAVEWSGREALLNGHWDRLLYEAGGLDRRLPFEQLRALSLVNARAEAEGESPGFSERIRAGLPPAPSAPPATPTRSGSARAPGS